MKIIIAGGRDVPRPVAEEAIKTAFKATGWLPQMTELVHGNCKGVDRTAAVMFRGKKPIKVFEADWIKYGKPAGPIRNALMASYADALIAIDSGGSGTRDMIKQAREAGLQVHVEFVSLDEGFVDA